MLPRRRLAAASLPPRCCGTARAQTWRLEARVCRIGYWLIPVVFATGFVLLGAEEVAVQLEQPFGDDSNDLPLDNMCFNLEADLMTLLNEEVEKE